MEKLYENAKQFIMENGDENQKNLFQYLIERKDKEEAVHTLRKYQNKDGGWANGLEIEYRGNVSTPMTTAAALSYIYMFELADTDLFSKTIEYLKNTQRDDGSWDDVDEVLEFEVPSYMGPGKYIDYKTAMNIKWLRRLKVEDEKIIDRGIAYLLNDFQRASREKDFWSAAAYSSLFSELPRLKETPKIMEWAMSVLIPPEAQNKTNEKLPWMQVQGMIYEDSPMAYKLKNEVVEAIKENQLPDGSWPHQFGTYNKVWASILIMRFLKLNKFV